MLQCSFFISLLLRFRDVNAGITFDNKQYQKKLKLDSNEDKVEI